jgi:hypothetical protein
MSGVAATLLGGETVHSACHINKWKEDVPDEDKKNWKNTQLIIVDEILFASPGLICKLQANLRSLLGSMNKHYGGFNVVFADDFYQLEPMKADPLFQTNCAEFHQLINCFIELNGQHQFKDDPEWGEILTCIRNGNCSVEDIQLINRECNMVNKRPPSGGKQVACPTNKQQDAINTAVFDQYCDENQPVDGALMKRAILVLMDNLQMETGKKTMTYMMEMAVKDYFYQKCGKNNCIWSESKQIDNSTLCTAIERGNVP